MPLLEIGKGSTSRGQGPNGAGFGDDGDVMFTLQAGAQHGVAMALNAHGGSGRMDGESETFVVPTLTGKSLSQARGWAEHNEAAHLVAVAHSLRADGFDASEDGTGRGTPLVATNEAGDTAPHDRRFGVSAVRRLTPRLRECCRLQGFSDSFFDGVFYRGKPLADGNKYRLLGNSMAVPVMSWIGQRIDLVSKE